MSGAALQGSFADLPLPEVLGLISASGRAGILSCTGVVDATVVVVPGAVAWAEPMPAPPVEEVVRAAGICEEPVVREAAAMARRSGSLVTSLLDVGVDADVLAALLLDHTSSVLVALLAHPQAAAATSFSFLAGASHPVGTPLAIPIDELLSTIGRRATDLDRIDVTLAGVSRFRLQPDPGHAEIVLDASEWRVLAHLDGSRTAQEVAAATGWSPFRVREVLAGLVARTLLVAAT